MVGQPPLQRRLPRLISKAAAFLPMPGITGRFNLPFATLFRSRQMSEWAGIPSTRGPRGVVGRGKKARGRLEGREGLGLDARCDRRSSEGPDDEQVRTAADAGFAHAAGLGRGALVGCRIVRVESAMGLGRVRGVDERHGLDSPEENESHLGADLARRELGKRREQDERERHAAHAIDTLRQYCSENPHTYATREYTPLGRWRPIFETIGLGPIASRAGGGPGASSIREPHRPASQSGDRRLIERLPTT